MELKSWRRSEKQKKINESDAQSIGDLQSGKVAPEEII